MITSNSLILISSAYLGGLLSCISPCIFPVIPVYLSMLSINGEKSIKRTILFILGLSVTFLVLGLGIGLVGKLLFNDYARILAGIIVIIMGLFQSEVFNVQFLNSTKVISQRMSKDSDFTPFILGLTFSIGWTPCVGPILASILLLSGTSGSMLNSVLMMIAYMAGLATPFVIFSFASRVFMQKTQFIKKHLVTIKKAGGYLMIIMGILLATNQLNALASIPFAPKDEAAPTVQVSQQDTANTNKANAPKQIQGPKINLADVTLTDMQGNPVSLEKYKGKKIYLKLWASWCPACRQSLPATEEMSKDSNKDFEVITVVFPGNFREKNPAQFAEWFKAMNYPDIKVLYDMNATLADKIDLHAFPTSILLDQDLNVIRVVPGHMDKAMIDYVFNMK